MGLGNFFSGIFGGGKKDEQKALPPPPAAPNPEAIAAEEKKKLQKRLANRTQTVFTSPLGASSSVNLERKQLLGG